LYKIIFLFEPSSFTNLLPQIILLTYKLQCSEQIASHCPTIAHFTFIAEIISSRKALTVPPLLILIDRKIEAA
jgi:hypothetical protein